MGDRSLLFVKMEALVRYTMCRFMGGYFPLYIVTEYPKSGGSWFSQMLAEALGIPFPRNELPKFTSQVMHGHYAYHPGLENVFCVIRDGRDVMVSFYYWSLFKSERSNARLVDRTRRDLRIDAPEDAWRNLPGFIEYKFEGGGYPRFTWDEFVRSWLDKDVVLVRYEDLLKNAASVLGQAIRRGVGVELRMETLNRIQRKYSFANLAKRRRGKERVGSYLRKGIAGDWKNKFSPEAREVFDHYAGDTLVAAGYEQDHNWVA